MEFILFWILLSAICLLITAVTVGIGYGIGISFMAAIIIFLVKSDTDDDFIKWAKQGYSGDHPYLEWMLCRKTWQEKMSEYDSDTYCKISFSDFEKYFAVNPSRYELGLSWVTVEKGDEEITMIFPWKDLFKYFIFRRQYLQSRRMVDIVNMVQEDIDSLRETAQKQLDEAKAMLKSDFKL